MQAGSGVTMPPAEVARRSRCANPTSSARSRVAQAINAELGADAARVVDPGTVAVRVPDEYRAVAARADGAARDAAGRQPTSRRAWSSTSARARSSSAATCASAPAAVAHGNLSVRISTQFEVSQPAPFSRPATPWSCPTRRSTCARATPGWSTLEEGDHARSGGARAQRARRVAARHHRHHAGAQGRRRAARRDRDPVAMPMPIDPSMRMNAPIAATPAPPPAPPSSCRSRRSCSSSRACSSPRCCAICA